MVSKVLTQKIALELMKWREFWSWLILSAGGEDVYWSDTTLQGWLQAKYEEYHGSEKVKE